MKPIGGKCLSVLFAVGTGLALIWVCRCLDSWYIDDSAISLAYARNLCRGIGLVAQIGDSPVEGFSNPLWVLSEALVMQLSGWHSLSIPRVLSCVLFVILISHIFLRYRGNIRAICIWQFALLLSVLQPAISIWSMSGLENGLLLFLVFELLMQLMAKDGGNPFAISCIAAALALTRPDAALFAFSYPLCFSLRSERPFKIYIKNIAVSLSSVVIVYGGYLLFRMMYFGDLVPNTFFAKSLPTVFSIKELLTLGYDVRERLMSALFASFGMASAWLCIGLCVCIWIYRERVPSWFKKHIPLFVVFALATTTYAYLPNDWAPCFRFATAAFASAYVIIAHAVISQGCWHLISVTILLLVSIPNFFVGVRHFVDNEPIAIAHVQERGSYFNRWGKYLGIDRPLVMTADAGGILWDEKVRLLDLGMLCDSTIAKCLGESSVVRDRKRFYDYVFEEKKPDFIATRAYHSYLPDLDKDPRFRRDYVAIHDYFDTWILNRYNRLMYSGDYVRRSLVDGRNDALIQMRNESASIFYPFDRGLSVK